MSVLLSSEGTASSYAACVGTPCRELKEKCQYRVGGQSGFTRISHSWGDALLLDRSPPSLFSLPAFSLKSWTSELVCSQHLLQCAADNEGFGSQSRGSCVSKPFLHQKLYFSFEKKKSRASRCKHCLNIST